VNLALRRRWKYLEIRSEVSERLFSSRLSFVEHVLRLDRDLQSIQTGLRGSTWRNIEKAVRAGVRIRCHTDLSSVKQFYRLHCQTRKRKGLPIQPEALFSNLYAFCIRQGHGFVLLARHNSHVIAGGVYLHLGSNAVYKYGASLLEFQAMRPNNVVMWDAICRCQAMGIRSLSFGRTDAGDTGLLQYKDGWGCSRNVVSYSRWDPQGVRTTIGNKTTESCARRILSIAPVQFLRLLGEVIYPHLG
jgi:hypothetical protein